MIIVINNASTDGTAEWLDLAAARHECIRVVHSPENRGGAGGFAMGIREAAGLGAEAVWLMDDDTIPHPDALERLLGATSVAPNVGFVCSKVICPDGLPHCMNVPGFAVSRSCRYEPVNRFSTQDVPAFAINMASFVSVLIDMEAVRKVGLPIEEFFIWGDDIEYTMRIRRAGFLGLYVDNSVVVHKTENYFPHPDLAPEKTAWKFYYQARNTIYIKRTSKRCSWAKLLISVINKYRLYMMRIGRRDKASRGAFAKAVRRGCIDGLSFKPTIKYLD